MFQDTIPPHCLSPEAVPLSPEVVPCPILLTQFGTRWTRNLALPDLHGVYEVL